MVEEGEEEEGEGEKGHVTAEPLHESGGVPSPYYLSGVFETAADPAAAAVRDPAAAAARDPCTRTGRAPPLTNPFTA